MDIHAVFRLNISDYRKAAYYGMVQRNRKTMRIAAFVLLAVISYVIFTQISGGQLQYIILFAAGGYLVWMLLQFARQEREIHSYIKSQDSILGKEFEMDFDKKHFRVVMPEKGVDNTFEIGKLAIVFELSELFILYASVKDAFLLPKRALSEAEIRWLRERFSALLGSKFESRFMKR